MAAYKKSLAFGVLVLLASVLAGSGSGSVVSGFSRTRAGAQVRLKADTTDATPQRIISLVPSVTEMLFAMGAGPRVVGVSNFDEYPAEVKTRTKVGGLIDPDIELILSLKPDLIVVYGTQSELRTQMERAGIPMFPYEHAGMADITTTIRALGQRVGSGPAATTLADRIDGDIADIRRRVAGRPHPRTMLVFGRDSETLRGVYASGGIGFLHDMLEAAGATDVFADIKRQSVQATTELVLTRAPEVILEIREGAGTRNLRAWDVLGSVPAVRNHRIYLVTGDEMVTPGPRVASAVRRLAEALHPDALK
jgi:iron complex transport system substrate-binding protein